MAVGILGVLALMSCCICYRFRNEGAEASSDSQDIETAAHAPDNHRGDDGIVASHMPDYLSDGAVGDAVSVASTPPDEEERNDAPEHMVCPISLSVMKDPCRCGDGRHNFERSYLLRHLRTNKPACPVSRIPMTAGDVVPNAELKAEIAAWLAEDPPAGNPVGVSAPEQRTPTKNSIVCQASSLARGGDPMVFQGGPSTGTGYFVHAGRCAQPLESLVFKCRVQVLKKQRYTRLFDLGNGPDKDNVWLGFAGAGEADRLVFEVLGRRGGRVVKTRTRGHPLNLRVWYDVRCELEKLNSTQSRARVWIDDRLTIDSPVPSPTRVPREGCYIGKSNYPVDALLTGQMTSVSLTLNGQEQYAWSA